MILQRNKILKFLTITAIINSLVITPFFNKDGMIIPKLMVIFISSMYMLPIIFQNIEVIKRFKLIKSTVIINLLIICQGIVVMFLSNAPLEQQIFGRTGRGLGFITILSLAIVFISTSLVISYDNLLILLSGLILSAFLSSIYALMQSFGFDLINWDTKTNGVIGTLGNPNFQSAFAAMALIPSFLYFYSIKNKKVWSMLIFVFFSLVIYRTYSRQGIVAGVASILITLLIYFWYKNIKIFFLVLTLSLTSFIFSIFGMLGRGPLSGYLYNVSVQSRGDFWRSAFTTSNNHPIFGVGLDSFGDYSLKYRDEIAAGHTFAEYTDNAHNFFLHLSSTGGYPLAILNVLLIIIVFLSFIKLQMNSNRFDPKLVSLFSAWIVFQFISIISPENLVNCYWNAIFSGAIIGLAKELSQVNEKKNQPLLYKLNPNRNLSFLLAVLGLIFLLPLFNTDRIQLKAMKSGNANLAISAATRFPESTVRYSLIGNELLKSGLSKQSLEVARSGVDFNPHSAGLWALILVNPIASLEERTIAKENILDLDPLNEAVRNFDLK